MSKSRSNSEVKIKEPTTSQAAMSQHWQYKNNKPSQRKASYANAIASTSRSNLNNAANHDISQQCQNISINSNQVKNAEQNYDKSASKNKNAKKKERSKDLNLQMPVINANPPQAVQTAPPVFAQNDVNQVNEFFYKHLTPLYANTSVRHLENLIHHPQYNHFYKMHGIHLREMFQFQNHQILASSPNSPLHPNATSVLGSYTPPVNLVQQPTTPKYIQNAMQHPLLSQTYINKNYINHNAHFPPLNKANANVHQNKTSNNSPNQKNKQKKDQNDEKRVFESYLNASNVLIGLKNNTLIEGVLRINPKQFQNSYVSSMVSNEQDILIEGIKNRNRALEGDVVFVQYIESDEEEEASNNADSDNKQKRGKVVYIKEKVHTRKCIGNLKLMPDKNRQRALFIPRDFRIPRLNIPFTNWPDNFYHDSKNYENTLFLANIVDWFDVRFALGRIICNLGQTGDIETENKAILAQWDLDVTPFGSDVRHLFPRLDYVVPEEEIKLREDCRKLCIFSIDPSNCRDIDDAVSCRKLDNGNYEVGVHISDVSYFLKENTLLDEQVSIKATTIYMVERAYHMLPDELCMLCSLFPGVDKLAFSVFWEMTEDGEIMNHRFARTVIHSCCQLAYDHAQAIIDGSEDAEKDFPEIYNEFQYTDIYNTIKILANMSAILRKRRFDNGALRIDQTKISFKLNPTNGLPESYCIYESKESHQLIEEYMLLANMAVANRIYEDHPQLAFLRCHPDPSSHMLKQLQKSLKPLGIDIDITTAGHLHKSILKYLESDDLHKGKAMVLNMLCTKPMTRAKYFCAASCGDDSFHHYALNVPLYTHFTSPIRRYADIMVHRLLAASLKYNELPSWEVDKVSMVAAQCNKQKYNAKRAGEMSTELYTLKYIELNSPVLTEAVVVEIRKKYIDVIVIAMGLNRRIFFNNDFPGEFNCIQNDADVKLTKMELTWKAIDTEPAVKQVIEVFSILQVELYKGDDMVKVETKIVRPN